MVLDFVSQSDYLWALLPEIVLSLWGMLVLLVDVFQKGSRSGPSRPMIPWLALAGLVAAGAANIWLLGLTESGTAGMVAVDSFRVFVNFIVLTAAAMSILISIGYPTATGINRGEFYALILLATVGMMLMAATRDLMLLFLALELMSIAVYVLVGFNRSDPRSGEGALKYFLLGAFSSAFLLYGIALVWGSSGSTNLGVIAPQVATALGSNPMFLTGAALLVVGLGFKVAAVPFHMWTPDAYDGAPTPVTAFMATGVKAAAFAAFIRIFAVAFGGAYEVWNGVLWWMAILTMFVANLIAITQGSVKRMLAYSSIAHAGYLLVAVVAANSYGAAAFLFYLLVYTLMTAGAFGVIIANTRGGRERISLQDYAGFGWEQPLLGAVFAVFLLSLAGFPLTGGFIGKLYILRAAISAGYQELAVALVIASLISYFYYLRVVVVMYMRPAATDDPQESLVASGPLRFTVAFAAIGVLLLFFFPMQFLQAAQQSVATLFAAPGAFFGLVP
jgi:NADH-quinone oxidoreductase subunit N